MGSVPLRGYGFEIPMRCFFDQSDERVSVPLRGYGFEMEHHQRDAVRRVFVSVPLRGYGFEMSLSGNALPRCEISFPSPYGDMVLKFKRKNPDSVAEAALFPSPCGDMVLKYQE